MLESQKGQFGGAVTQWVKALYHKPESLRRSFLDSFPINFLSIFTILSEYKQKYEKSQKDVGTDWKKLI